MCNNTLVNCINKQYNIHRWECFDLTEKKNSEARIRANNKYNEKAYDRINIAVQKGRKAEIEAHAQSKGESVNGFVNRAIDETMKRDGKQNGN